MPATAKALTTSRPYRMLVRRVVVPWVLQRQQLGGEGLEIGAGSGAMTAQLLEAFPALRMVATDVDADMVSAALETLAPYSDRVEVAKADATDLPFTDGRFDVVLSAAMLHHTMAWEGALEEAVRVLRPGGRLIGYDVVDTLVARSMHFGSGHETRMLRADDLNVELHRLQLTCVRTTRGAGGLVVRFTATKPPPSEGRPQQA